MSEMLTPRRIHYGLRSQDDLKLDVPKTKRKTLGYRAFKVSAPKLWNSLPKDVSICNNFSISKSKLKTHYLELYTINLLILLIEILLHLLDTYIKYVGRFY